MKLDQNHLHRIEHGISPVLDPVVTIPTDHHGVTIYVTIGMFDMARPRRRAACDRAVVEVARALTVGQPKLGATERELDRLRVMRDAARERADLAYALGAEETVEEHEADYVTLTSVLVLLGGAP